MSVFHLTTSSICSSICPFLFPFIHRPYIFALVGQHFIHPPLPIKQQERFIHQLPYKHSSTYKIHPFWLFHIWCHQLKFSQIAHIIHPSIHPSTKYNTLTTWTSIILVVEMYNFSIFFFLQRTRLLEGKKKMFGNIFKNSISKWNIGKIPN